MEHENMIWAVYEGPEADDPIGIFRENHHASAFARLDDKWLIGALDNETAARVRPQPLG
jgi:hypothetical protein